MESPSHTPLTRAARGRWLAGVCAGIARVRGIPVGTVRAGFVLTTAFAGLGALVYLACWLVIPAEGEAAAAARGTGRVAPRGITSVILGCAALAGLGTLGLAGGAATIFGFGWIVAVVGAAVLLGTLVSWPRVGPAWALLPVAALALPSLVLAASGVHVAAKAGDHTYAPKALTDIPHNGYEAGLGTMLVDLRHTALPASGDLRLRIDGGVRRTILALPHDRCVPVSVAYHVDPFAVRAASFLTGSSYSASTVTVFSTYNFQSGNATWPATINAAGAPAGPVLHVDFTSEGGSLLVRDFPDDVDPDTNPNWPGFLGDQVEPRPETTGVPKAVRRRELAAWRVRARAQRRAARRVRDLMGGPCVPPAPAKHKETKR